MANELTLHRVVANSGTSEQSFFISATQAYNNVIFELYLSRDANFIVHGTEKPNLPNAYENVDYYPVNKYILKNWSIQVGVDKYEFKMTLSNMLPFFYNGKYQIRVNGSIVTTGDVPEFEIV